MSLNLQYRIELLVRLGNYMLGNEEVWQVTKEQAFRDNNWFIPHFVDCSVTNIAQNFLVKERLVAWANRYFLPYKNNQPQKVGVVLAGNIPLVGFHDVLAVFVTGDFAIIKPSSKDETLIKHLIKKLTEWESGATPYFVLQPLLKNCDAYIATGSNNTARYFDYYFQKYPHIIRKNRTSVAILTGSETEAELEKLADDVHLYFGMGCRNVTKLYVPEHYDFVPLLEAFRKYAYFINHHKYKNNYDYNLTLHILNNQYYMTNGSILLVENPSPFSPISQIHYEFYNDIGGVQTELERSTDIQCIVGNSNLTFGQAQYPALTDYADGVDTINFLVNLKN